MFFNNRKKLAILTMFFLVYLASHASVYAENKGYGRLVKNLNENWKFYKGAQSEKENFSTIAFNDTSWKQVNLPHTWNAKDGSDGGNNYYRGDGWYRKELSVPKSYKGKSLYLQFAAANKEAEVFVNGKLIGTHMGGYTAFTVEISDYVNYGKKNLIAVRVNNTTNGTIPLSGDFTFYGGLYRGVSLVVADKTHIDLQDDGSKGIYISIPNDQSIKKLAPLSVKVPLKINKKVAAKVIVKAALKNRMGNVVQAAVLKEDRNQLRPADGIILLTGTMKVKNPHLWNGIADPYLYTVEVTVSRNEKVIDQLTEKIGFRYYSVDPDKGFFLNGKNYLLHGVAIHQDRQGYGNAVPEKIKKEDFQLIKEIGANTIRAAHYPHSPFVYDQADKLGLIVWAEIPFVNEMRTTVKFAENANQQLREMIKQNYNHPSIVTWGLQNELGAFGGYTPGSTLPKEVQYRQAVELLQRLAATAKTLNPERYVSQAIMGVPAAKGIPLTPKVEEQLDWGANKGVNDKIGKFIDLSSLNFYFGWYTPHIDDLDTAITHLHNQYPDAVLGISEYGAGANPAQHQLIGRGFKWNAAQNALGQWHPEEYQSYWHERSYSIIKRHPELWATFVWIMFDFGSDLRNEGNNPGINDKGLITFDRSIKKDAFYFYKAQWNNNDPFVYITSRRYEERDKRDTPVKVYSNLKNVTLSVNGKNLGSGRLQQPGVFVWDQVELRKSGNVVVASAKNSSGKVVKDSITSWSVK